MAMVCITGGRECNGCMICMGLQGKRTEEWKSETKHKVGACKSEKEQRK